MSTEIHAINSCLYEVHQIDEETKSSGFDWPDRNKNFTSKRKERRSKAISQT